jgi:hypothetical protein
MKMKHFILAGLFFMIGFASLRAVEGPGEYTFTDTSIKQTWREKAPLPADCVAVTPTCLYSKAQKTVYLLTELTGIREGYETEFIVLGPLSDRAYEGLTMAWDAPSTVSKAVEALGVKPGVAADALRGLAMAQGERFTVSVCRLTDASPTFLPLSDFVTDDFSTPAQNLLGRGFPFVGGQAFDDLMPASIIAAYTEKASTFGLPYYAEKGAAYGSFRAKTTEQKGAPAVVALQWQPLPNGQARVHHADICISAAHLKDPDAFLTQLKMFCDDPRDVFLNVSFDDALTLKSVAPLANLIIALEASGGFTLAPPKGGYLPVRAFAPDEAWRNREARLFQPWEVEFEKADATAPVKVNLCQIIEDWSVEGNDPALTRKCYPGVTTQTILNVMKQVDTNNGKVYVAFFYCSPQLTIGELMPYACILAEACPTQWVFFSE